MFSEKKFFFQCILIFFFIFVINIKIIKNLLKIDFSQFKIKKQNRNRNFCRNNRRKEQNRLDYIDAVAKKEELDEAYRQKMNQKKKAEEEKTAKRRQKRMKQKAAAKKRKMAKKEENDDESEIFEQIN